MPLAWWTLRRQWTGSSVAWRRTRGRLSKWAYKRGVLGLGAFGVAVESVMIGMEEKIKVGVAFNGLLNGDHVGGGEFMGGMESLN